MDDAGRQIEIPATVRRVAYRFQAEEPRFFVMTPADRSEEPSAGDHDRAPARLAGFADGLLVHDRPVAFG